MGERLVFVTIKDGPTLPSGRPLRRAVVPVDTTTTWKSFQSVVMKKLRVAQVGSFYSKQGHRVETMKEVMAVDDLEVEEIKAAASAPQPVTPHEHHRHVSMDLASPGGSARRHRREGSSGGSGRFENGNGLSSSHQDFGEDENGKHKPRVGTQINLMLQKVGLKPSPGLPVTSDGKDSSSLGTKRGTSALRKSRKGALSASRKGGLSMSFVVSVSMVLCFFTMIILYYSLVKSQG